MTGEGINDGEQVNACVLLLHWQSRSVPEMEVAVEADCEPVVQKPKLVGGSIRVVEL